MIRGIFSASIVACLAFLGPPARAQDNNYVSDKFKYSLVVPPKWNMDVNLSGVPVLFNYQRGREGPQGLFPDDGAQIYLIPFEVVSVVTNAKTFDEWIHQNLWPDHTNVSLRHIPDTTTRSRETSVRSPRNIVGVQADYERDPHDGLLQHEIDYYFTLGESMFRLRLLYWKGNPREAALRSIFDAVFRSIRSTT